MPRFVLLFHECPPESHRSSHWDFMLESGEVLRTWALSANPATDEFSGEKIDAEPLADHRLAYLEYEGPISEGRGKVERVEAGQYGITSETERELVLELFGAKLTGRWKLSRSPANESGHWLLSRM